MNIKALIITAIITVLTLSGFYHCSKSGSKPDVENTTSPKELKMDKKTKIKYYIKEIERNDITLPNLFAELKGKKYSSVGTVNDVLIIPLSIEKIMDFNEDGYEDALILTGPCYPGNGCMFSYTFCYYSPDDKNFIMSEEFGDNVDEDAVIEKWKDKTSVIVKSHTISGIQISTARYILKNGHAIQVEYKENVKLKAILELDGANEETGSKLFFDLDGDGAKDYIFGEYNGDKYFGLIFKYVKFANGKTFEIDTWCERIGVLSSKTNGVHDIVLNLDEIMIWDGKKYIFKEVGNSSKL
jgi:hypothetical protein